MTIATRLDEFETIGDLLQALGGIGPTRVRFRPTPGTATEADLVAVNARKQGICELVDGVLVAKPMGKLESILAGAILAILREFVLAHNLGIITAPDGMMRLGPNTWRAPDVAFSAWARIPVGPLTEKSLAAVVPDLAIEVLSPSNTKSEMARKRREYFAAGVRLVWEVDLPSRTVAVYQDPRNGTRRDASMSLEAPEILPGFRLAISDLFADLDRRQP